MNLVTVRGLKRTLGLNFHPYNTDFCATPSAVVVHPKILSSQLVLASSPLLRAAIHEINVQCFQPCERGLKTVTSKL